MVNDIVVPEQEAFMRKVSSDPNQLLALKQQIDQMVGQFAPEMVQPPAQVDPATGQPMAPQQPQAPQGGGGLEGLMSQPLGAIVQQLVGRLGL